MGKWLNLFGVAVAAAALSACQKPAADTHKTSAGTTASPTTPVDSMPPALKGKAAFASGDYDTAAKYLPDAAQAGDATAALYLGTMYGDGKGVEKDLSQAVKWYHIAALKGEPNAQFNLGLSYQTGQGLPQNYKEALLWYQRAAENGQSDAQNNLGVMYSNGLGVEVDEVRAHMWFNIAASMDDKKGIENRDQIAGRMTAQQLDHAQQMARKCMESCFVADRIS